MLVADETISIVNRYTSKGQSAYSVRVIRGCSWYWKDAVVGSGNGLQRVHTLRCRIPVDAVGADGYVTPQKWKTLSAEDRAGRWTLQPGDMICRGELAQVEPGKFNSLPTLMEAATIRSAHDNRRGVLQHWAVEGE